MTVLIGEAGPGSQAGAAASAMAAAAAKTGNPKAVDPYPLGEPGPVTENHYLECQVVDSAGKPLGGVKYKLTDPDNQVIVGVCSPEAASTIAATPRPKLQSRGPGHLGSQVSKDMAKLGDTVKLTAKAEGYEDGQEAWFGFSRRPAPISTTWPACSKPR